MSQSDNTEAEQAFIALENAADDLLGIDPAKLADVWLESDGVRIPPADRLGDVAAKLRGVIAAMEAVYQNRQAAVAKMGEA